MWNSGHPDAKHYMSLSLQLLLAQIDDPSASNITVSDLVRVSSCITHRCMIVNSPVGPLVMSQVDESTTLKSAVFCVVVRCMFYFMFIPVTNKTINFICLAVKHTRSMPRHVQPNDVHVLSTPEIQPPGYLSENKDATIPMVARLEFVIPESAQRLMYPTQRLILHDPIQAAAFIGCKLSDFMERIFDGSIHLSRPKDGCGYYFI